MRLSIESILLERTEHFNAVKVGNMFKDLTESTISIIIAVAIIAITASWLSSTLSGLVTSAFQLLPH
jgi:hypothetical protein